MYIYIYVYIGSPFERREKQTEKATQEIQLGSIRAWHRWPEKHASIFLIKHDGAVTDLLWYM
jgi:hypothetical protein